MIFGSLGDLKLPVDIDGDFNDFNVMTYNDT